MDGKHDPAQTGRNQNVSTDKNPGKISVQVKFGDVEQTFEGNVNDVWFLVNRFFSENVPSLEIVNKIMLTVDLQSLVEDCKDIVAITPEGIAVLVSKEHLTDNEALMLHLLAGYVGQKLGVLETASLTKETLQNGLGKSAKIISTRLGELCRKGDVVKMNGDYKISTIGIKTLQNELLPKLKAKTKP
jgi:hypothetical protein